MAISIGINAGLKINLHNSKEISDYFASSNSRDCHHFLEKLIDYIIHEALQSRMNFALLTFAREEAIKPKYPYKILEYAMYAGKLMDFIKKYEQRISRLRLIQDAQLISKDIVFLELPAFFHSIPKEFEYSQKCWESLIRAVEMLIDRSNGLLIDDKRLNLILHFRQMIIGPIGPNLKMLIREAKLLAEQGYIYSFFLKHRECRLGIIRFKNELDRFYSAYRQNSSSLGDLPQVSHVLLGRMRCYEVKMQKYHGKLRRLGLFQNLCDNLIRRFRF